MSYHSFVNTLAQQTQVLISTSSSLYYLLWRNGNIVRNSSKALLPFDHVAFLKSNHHRQKWVDFEFPTPCMLREFS